MKHLFLVIMVALLCIPASVHAQGAPSAMTRSETIPFLAVQLHDRVDVHNGPGANYTMVGWLPAGFILKVIGCSVECTWLQIASAGWIAADQVAPVIAFALPDGTIGVRGSAAANASAQLPTATPPMAATIAPTLQPLVPTLIPQQEQPAPSAITPTETPTPMPAATMTVIATAIPTETPTATPIATAAPLVYECFSDTYNCDNFSWQDEAQGVFEYCRDLGAGDVHDLDRNSDGVACEDSPRR